MARLVDLARRTLTGARDAWLILGLALLLLVGAELGYRAQRAVRDAVRSDAIRPAPPPEHPYASEEWYWSWDRPQGQLEGPRPGFDVVYDPYRGWWVTPWSARGITVGEDGLRRTVQPEAAGPRSVFFLGGSTMWGYTARDAWTIPSLVAAQVADLGVQGVEMRNLAQSAYNLTQELATLVLELRRGDVPTVAVFLDGVNEIGPVVLGGRPGEIYYQSHAVERFRRGGEPDASAVLRWLSRSALVKRLASLKGPPAPPTPEIPEGTCDEIALYYRNLTRSVEALGREFGFAPLFLWQPTLATSSKPVGPWETRLLAEPVDARRIELTRRCSRAVTEQMGDRRGTTFVDLDEVFDDHPEDVFIDNFGHLTEAGNAVVAARITELVLPLLTR